MGFGCRVKSMIYLDNAASSHPKPRAVIRAVERQLKENGANPGRSGHHMAMKASNVVYSCRSSLAKFFGTITRPITLNPQMMCTEPMEKLDSKENKDDFHGIG